MTELASSIGRKKASQVRHSNQGSMFELCFNINATGRGVLIDYASWAENKGIKYTTFSQHQIKLSDIHEIAQECNITFKKGDILLVRIGVIKEWEKEMDVEAKKAYACSKSPKHAGVEGSLDVLKWVWNTGFAAVAGDAISWEVSRFCTVNPILGTPDTARFIRLLRVAFSCTNICSAAGECPLVRLICQRSETCKANF